MNKKISAPVIGILSQVIPNHFTHAEIENIFFAAGAPEEIPAGSKNSKVQVWLRDINEWSKNPLDVLGRILENFLDQDPEDKYWGTSWSERENANALRMKEGQDRILNALQKDGLRYSRGGHITHGIMTTALSLRESVEQKGHSAIEIEITRALENVDKDPLAAVHNAGSILEATFKAYLNSHSVEFNDDKDTLSSLWQKVVEHIGIRPKDIEDKNLKKISSGLYNIVEGTMHLRNKNSAAHGKTEQQIRQNNIRPRHARLAIHAAHTIASYVIEFMDTDTKTQSQNSG